MPAKIFMSVDLPAPFSPTTARTAPARTSSETRSNARTPGKLLLTSRTSNSGRVMLLLRRQLLEHPLTPLLSIDRVRLTDKDGDLAPLRHHFLDQLADRAA